MNRGRCGIVLILAALGVFAVRHVTATWMAVKHPLNNIVRSFNSIQENTGTTLLVLGTGSILLGLVLLGLELRGGGKQ